MIAIKNVKIPDGGCLFCPFEYGFDCRNRESIRKSTRGDGRPDWCPLIDLPDGLYQVQGEKIWKYHGKGEKRWK